MWVVALGAPRLSRVFSVAVLALRKPSKQQDAGIATLKLFCQCARRLRCRERFAPKDFPWQLLRGRSQWQRGCAALPIHQSAATPFQSMYAARPKSRLANMRLSCFTGNWCAARAPSGAVSTLQVAITANAGSQM